MKYSEFFKLAARLLGLRLGPASSPRDRAERTAVERGENPEPFPAPFHPTVFENCRQLTEK